MRGIVLKLLLSSAIIVGGAVTVQQEVYAKTNTDIKSNVLLAENTGLQNGKYKVSVKTLKENSDGISMAGQYVDQTATLDVSNGKKYLNLGISRSDWMKNIKITVNGSSAPFKLVNKGGNNAVVKFEIPDLKAKIKFSMNVVPMGNANVSFRVVLGDNFTKISSDNNANSTSNKSEAKNQNTTKSSVPTSTKNTTNNKQETTNTNVQENADSKDLPETGSKIPQGAVIGFGGLAAIAGAILIKKKM